MWRFLIARDTMHQRQWLAVLEELEDPANAPGDFENEGEFAQIAYGFFNHTDAPPPSDAAWTSGPSLDGKGQFHIVDPLSTSAPRPDGDGGSPGLLSQMHDMLKA